MRPRQVVQPGFALVGIFFPLISLSVALVAVPFPLISDLLALISD